MRQVWDVVTKFHMLEPGDHVLLGVSGGPDSVALLHLLHSEAEHYGIALHVVHVNHNLRPEAAEEAAYVQQLAERYGVPFRVYDIDVTGYAEVHGMSLEQAGHVLRFRCFEDAKQHWKVNKLALGHHKDDRAESLLLHLIQGCGLDGLAAMPPIDDWNRDDGSKLIRPLAHVTKQEVLQYCEAQQLKYYIDASNLEPDCLRNQMRLELLPLMKQYNGQMVDALVRLQDSAQGDLDYMEQQVNGLWHEYGVCADEAVQFPAEVFRVQHIAIQRRLLRLMYEQFCGSTADLYYRQIEQMRTVAMQSDGTQTVTLANGVVFVRRYGTLYLTEQSEQQGQTYDSCMWQWQVQSAVQAWGGTFTAELCEFDENRCDGIGQKHGFNTVFVDADTLAESLQMRGRQAGDVIQPVGMQGHKKVKKLFIDLKIPKEQRDSIPMVVSHGQIVWIPGYFLSECVRITKKTKRVCKLSFAVNL